MSDAPQNPAYLFESYFGPALFRPWATRILETAAPNPGDNVLDLACATGTVARMLGARGGHRVVGLDFSPAMLEVAREAGEQEGVDIEWIESSADAMPFSEHEFDLVISQQGLQFFPDRVEAAKDIYRVLKPGGRLVASVWQGVERHPLWGKMFETVSKRLDAPLSAVALPFMMGDQSELRSYLEKGGFSEVSITEESLVLRFPEPGRFIQLSVAAAGAAIPALGAMDPETRKSVIAEIVETLSPEVAQNVNDGFVVMDSHLNQAIATK